MSVSIWQRAEMPETIECDTVVIGGGICGIWTAIELERRGQSVVLLERSAQLGAGASTRNAGYLMRGAADNYAAACDTLGRDAARTAWRMSEQNLAILREEGLALSGAAEDRPSCLVAHEADEADALERSVRLLREDGFAADVVEHGTDAMWTNARPLVGLVNPDDAVCHSGRLLAWASGKLERTRVRLGEQVHAISPGGGGVIVEAAASRVHAGRAVLCTNALVGTLVPALADLVTPNRGQMLAIRSPGTRLEHAYYANHGSEYIRTAGDLVLMGGCRKTDEHGERTAEENCTPGIQRALEAYAARVLGGPIAPEAVVARWAGTMGFSPDGLPLAGPVGELVGKGVFGDAVWFIGGFTGHGMSLAVATARSAVCAMLDRTDPAFAIGRLLGAD